MPNGKGIPLLIQLARTSRNAEVRKQASAGTGWGFSLPIVYLVWAFVLLVLFRFAAALQD